jgi:hypothetical protein
MTNPVSKAARGAGIMAVQFVTAGQLEAAAGVLRRLEGINREIGELQLRLDRGEIWLTLGDGDRRTHSVGEVPTELRPELVALVDKVYFAQQQGQLDRLAEIGIAPAQVTLARLEWRGA